MELAEITRLSWKQGGNKHKGKEKETLMSFNDA